MEGQPLLGVLRGLILDDGAQAEFTADPSGYTARRVRRHQRGET